MWFYGIMVHKKVNSDRATKRHFETTILHTVNPGCYDKTTALYYKHGNGEKFNQRDIIIQFTVACFTALCTLKSNLHL